MLHVCRYNWVWGYVFWDCECYCCDYHCGVTRESAGVDLGMLKGGADTVYVQGRRKQFESGLALQKAVHI